MQQRRNTVVQKGVKRNIRPIRMKNITKKEVMVTIQDIGWSDPVVFPLANEMYHTTMFSISLPESPHRLYPKLQSESFRVRILLVLIDHARYPQM